MSANGDGREVWKIRAFRLWIVVFIPAFLFLSFQILNASSRIAEAEALVYSWVQVESARAERGERAPLTDADIQFQRLGFDFAREYRHKNEAAFLLISALAIPAAVMILGMVGSWIWKSRSGSLVGGASSPEWRKYRKVYAWSAITISCVTWALFISPASSIQSIVSALVQVTGLAVVVGIAFGVKSLAEKFQRR